MNYIMNPNFWEDRLIEDEYNAIKFKYDKWEKMILINLPTFFALEKKWVIKEIMTDSREYLSAMLLEKLDEQRIFVNNLNKYWTDRDNNELTILHNTYNKIFSWNFTYANWDSPINFPIIRLWWGRFFQFSEGFEMSNNK